MPPKRRGAQAGDAGQASDKQEKRPRSAAKSAKDLGDAETPDLTPEKPDPKKARTFQNLTNDEKVSVADNLKEQEGRRLYDDAGDARQDAGGRRDWSEGCYGKTNALDHMPKIEPKDKENNRSYDNYHDDAPVTDSDMLDYCSEGSQPAYLPGDEVTLDDLNKAATTAKSREIIMMMLGKVRKKLRIRAATPPKTFRTGLVKTAVASHSTSLPRRHLQF